MNKASRSPEIIAALLNIITILINTNRSNTSSDSKSSELPESKRTEITEGVHITVPLISQLPSILDIIIELMKNKLCKDLTKQDVAAKSWKGNLQEEVIYKSAVSLLWKLVEDSECFQNESDNPSKPFNSVFKEGNLLKNMKKAIFMTI